MYVSGDMSLLPLVSVFRSAGKPLTDLGVDYTRQIKTTLSFF